MSADQTNRWQVWLAAPLVLVLILLLLPVVLAWLILDLVAKLFLLAAVWILWAPRGKDVLVVYSRSPHWVEYFELSLIPRLERRVMVLNWSDRLQWSRFELRTRLFKAFKGDRDFNPMVLVCKPFYWPRSFRFYDCFKKFKHGNEQPLHELESKLETYLKNG